MVFFSRHFTTLQQEISCGIKDSIYSLLLLVTTDNNHVADLHRQAALGRQDLYCMYPTHDEEDSQTSLINLLINF